MCCSRELGSPPPMCSRHSNLKPLGRQHTIIYLLNTQHRVPKLSTMFFIYPCDIWFVIWLQDTCYTWSPKYTSLAALSANSFGLMPAWPGIHMSFIYTSWFTIDSISQAHSSTNRLYFLVKPLTWLKAVLQSVCRRTLCGLGKVESILFTYERASWMAHSTHEWT